MNSSEPTHRQNSTLPFRAFAVGLAIIVLLAAWYLRDLLLLVFASVLVACMLVSFARIIARLPNLPPRASFALACLGAILLCAGFVWLLGTQLRGQFMDLWDQMPALLAPVEKSLGIESVEQWLADRMEAALSQASVVSRIAGFSSAAAGVAANFVLVVVAGFYLASQPNLYFGGLVRLFPPNARPKASRTLLSIGEGLQRWLAGQLLAMVVVALLTYVGLAIIGVPSALALAVVAGTLEFVPFLGPVLAAVPAVALGLSAGTETAIYVGLLYLGIQQLEGNLITPLVQQRTVHLPPAVTLFAILAAGLVFGWLGVLLATPLTVALMISVEELWVERLEHG